MEAKDTASAIGLVLVGGTAFLLAIAEKLDQHGRLTLEHSFWIAFVMTALSFICFGVEKYLNSKEEKLRALDEAQRKLDEIQRKKDEIARKKRETKRDKLIEEMAERLKRMEEAQKALAPEQMKKLDQAYFLYSTLKTTANEPDNEAARTLRELFAKNDVKVSGWKDITEEYKSSYEEREAVRDKADSLLRSVFGLPDDEDETPD
jgi:hypothetical protein